MSSYKKNHYDLVFQSLVAAINPKMVVEFGILKGYSTDAILKSLSKSSELIICDIFDIFKYNHADWDYINKKYKDEKAVRIINGNYYDESDRFRDNSIDLLHIDIANNGYTYEIFFREYYPKLSSNGIAVLEGGSLERDNIEWMKKYKKPKIRPVISEYRAQGYDINTIEAFPSITIIKKHS